MPDGTLAELKPALDDEQLADVKDIMQRMIDVRIECAAEFLEWVSGRRNIESVAVETKPEPVCVAEPEAKCEEEPVSVVAAEPEPICEPEEKVAAPVIPEEIKKAKPGRKSEMTVQEVKRMLIDGYSVQDIANKFGYKSTQTVYNFINKNGLKVDILTAGNDTARELTEKDIPQIRALYTDGPMNLTETAAELNTTKKKLHEFCEKNHILKVKPVR